MKTKFPNFGDLNSYIKLILETLKDEKFKKYTEFCYLTSRPEFHLLPKEIKKKVLKHYESHFKKFGYD